jgi:hypothetical protein
VATRSIPSSPQIQNPSKTSDRTDTTNPSDIPCTGAESHASVPHERDCSYSPPRTPRPRPRPGTYRVRRPPCASPKEKRLTDAAPNSLHISLPFPHPPENLILFLPFTSLHLSPPSDPNSGRAAPSEFETLGGRICSRWRRQYNRDFAAFRG